MIRTTMAHKSGSNPGVVKHNTGSHPGSRSVIGTTVKKPSCRADNFVKHSSRCGGITGGPGTKVIDGKWI